MSSKDKKPPQKRASAPLACDYAKQFAKDWERLSRSGRHDLGRAKAGMMLLIANDDAMPAGYRDHQLSGALEEFREFHAGGDLLVMYERAKGAVIFARIGTHAELFE